MSQPQAEFYDEENRKKEKTTQNGRISNYYPDNTKKETKHGNWSNRH